MKIKTSEATGAVLDWVVAKAENRLGLTGLDQAFGVIVVGNFLYTRDADGDREWYAPSTDWSQGGPIIERWKLCIGFQHQLDTLYVPEIDPDVICWARTTAGGYLKYGPTPLIAAMRCFVASRLGEEVDVPEELL